MDGGGQGTLQFRGTEDRHPPSPALILNLSKAGRGPASTQVIGFSRFLVPTSSGASRCLFPASDAKGGHGSYLEKQNVDTRDRM
jgi:hypothetical protein